MYFSVLSNVILGFTLRPFMYKVYVELLQMVFKI